MPKHIEGSSGGEPCPVPAASPTQLAHSTALRGGGSSCGPLLPPSQAGCSLGPRLSGDATASKLSPPCTEMGSPLSPRPLSREHQSSRGQLARLSSWRRKREALDCRGTSDGEAGRIWEWLPPAEGGAFSSGAAGLEYHISFQVSGVVVRHSYHPRGDP